VLPFADSLGDLPPLGQVSRKLRVGLGGGSLVVKVWPALASVSGLFEF
jgi:hypothetical protein